MPITVTELLARISVDETGLDKGLASADGKLNKFAGNASSAAERVAKAFAPAEAAVSSLAKAAVQAAQDSFDLSGASDTLSRALKGVGTGAGAADTRIAALSGSSASLASVLSTLEASTAATDKALAGLDEGASFAQKALSGLGRVAGNVLPRLDALSGAKFDPAGIVAGADTATASLDALKAAARGVPGAVRAAGAGSPVFLRGGRGIGEAAGERMGFGGGVRAGMGAAGDMAGGAAMLTTLLAAVSGKMAMDFGNLLQGVKGNTTMSDADASAMRQLTLQLMKTGTPDEQIAKAFMHVQNFAYKGKDAASIVTEGNKMGVATHSPVEETGRILAATLREYNLPATMSRQMAETLHLTSASGDMYLKEFDKYAGKAFATGAADKVNVSEIAAALSAITQHGIAIPKASTQVTGMLKQIVNPTKKGKDAADALGIGEDFTPQGLLKKQLSGVMADVMRVTGGDAGKIGTLFNGMQGGLGAKILTGMGAGTYSTALNDPKTGTKAAFAGKTNAIDPLYNQQMQQTTQQFKALSGEIRADFIPIGAKLAPLFTAAIPVVRAFAHVLTELLDGFAKLPKPVQEAILAFGAFKIVSSFLPMLGGFALVSERTTVVLGGLSRALMGGGAAAEVGAAGIAGMALPLVAVAAAVALFALAWKTDFGHIREVTAKVGAEVMGFVNSQFGQVKAWFLTNLPLIRETVKTVLNTIKEFWHDHGERIMAIIGPMWDLIKQTFVNAIHLVEQVLKLGLDLVTGHWRSAGMDVIAIVRTLFSELLVIIVNGGKIVGNAVSLIADLIQDLGKRFFAATLSLGQQLINGLVNGIKAGYSKVADAAIGLGHSVTGAVHGALQIQSPSRVMFNAGIMAAAGLTLGLAAGTPSVAAAADQMGQAVHARVRKHLTDAQKEARSLPGDMAKSRVTGQFLEGGYSASAARAAGRYHALGPDAQKEIADQSQANTELQRTAALWKSFSERVAGAKAQLLDLRKAQKEGGSKSDLTIAGTVARDFPRIPAADRATLTNLLQQGAALKQQVADAAKATEAVKAFHTEMGQAAKGAADQISALTAETDPMRAKWDAYLKGHVQLAEAIKKDAASAASAFREFAAASAQAEKGDGLKRLSEMSAEWAGKLSESAEPAKTNLEAVNLEIAKIISQFHLAASDPDAKAFFAQIRGSAEQTDLADVNKSVATLRSKSSTELSEVQARIAGIYDPAKAAGDAWLANNQALADKIKALYADPKDAAPLIGILQGDASKKAAADQQLAGVEKMRSMMADLRKQMLDMSTTDPLAKFKVSMLEMDENGRLALPKGISDSDLTQAFKMQQQIAAMQKTQEMLGTLKQGMVDAVSGALQGIFSGANSGGGQDWNSLTQQLTELQQQKTSLAQSLLLAPKQIAGTNNLTVITEAKQTTKASLDAVDKQIADTKKKLGGFHRDALTMFTGFFSSVTKGFAGMLTKMGMELIQSMLMKSLTKMIGGGFGGGGFGGGGGLLGSIAGIAGPLLGSLGGSSSGGMITSGPFSVPGVSIQGMGLARRAFGGPAFAGSSYVVGDGGEPEVFTPGESGHITPLSRAGGGDVHVNMTITTPDANSFRASQGQIMADAYSAGQRAKQRSGR